MQFDSCPRPCRQSRRKAHEAHRRPLEAVGLFRVPAGFPDLRRLLLRDQLRAAKEREANAALAQQVRQAEERLSEQEETTAPETEEDAGPLPQYQALAEQNADFYGWVRIRGPSWTIR